VPVEENPRIKGNTKTRCSAWGKICNYEMYSPFTFWTEHAHKPLSQHITTHLPYNLLLNHSPQSVLWCTLVVFFVAISCAYSPATTYTVPRQPLSLELSYGSYILKSWL